MSLDQFINDQRLLLKNLTPEQTAALERMEAFVRADENAKATAIERERCAKVADAQKYPKANSEGAEAFNAACDECAAAIRAGEKPANPSQSTR